MVLPNWGQLEKSQTDDETITEAIAAAIAVHNADSEAHLDDGESLEAHKTEDVIDHPQGSVLPDKVSFNDLMFDTTFESTSGFTKVGSVSNSSWPGAILEVDDGGTEISSIRANTIGILSTGTLDHNVLFDTYFYADTVGTTMIFNAGIVNTALSDWRLGFRLTGGNIVGFAYWSSSEHVTGTLHTPSAGALVFVRVYYDYAGGTVYFYVNGSLAGTLTPAADISIHNQFGFHADANGEESGVVRIFRFTLSRPF